MWICLIAYLLCHLFQGLQFRVINEVELRDEVVVVLVAGIDVGLGTHAADAVKVMDVNMHKHSEEAAQDLLAHLLEVLRERYTLVGKMSSLLMSDSIQSISRFMYLRAGSLVGFL